MVPILEKSASLKASKYRVLIGFWGSIVSIGYICSTVALFRDYPEVNSLSDACATALIAGSSGSSSATASNMSNSTPLCLPTHQLLCSPQEIEFILATRFSGVIFRLNIVATALSFACSGVLCFFAWFGGGQYDLQGRPMSSSQTFHGTINTI